MANSNTQHSKKLRNETSKKWQRENSKKITLNFAPKDHDLIENFKSIEAENNIERFRLLIKNFLK